MRALLLSVLVGSTAVAAPVPRDPERPVSDKVIRAWKDAGADVRWVTTSGLWNDKPTPGCRVGFRFHGWTPGRSDDLPAPEAPFHLDVSFPWKGDETAGVAQEIGDEGLAELVKFEHLRALDVFGTGITDAGAKRIAALKGLVQLDLNCTKVTAAGLKDLAGLRAVTRLSLSQMDVNEEMLAEVAGFKNLGRFDLSFNGSEVTAAGMRHLAGLDKLEKLGFFRVDVSDAAAAELGRAKRLKDADFLNTNVTEAGAAALRKRRPGCDVSARTVDLTPPPPPKD